MSPSRAELRAAFVQAWQRAQAGLPLVGPQVHIADVLHRHPEYQRLLEDPDAAAQDFPPDAENPFLHMGLHIALAEQRAAGVPPELPLALTALTRRGGDAHQAEHRVMGELARLLDDAQRAGREPDIEAFRETLRRLARG